MILITAGYTVKSGPYRLYTNLSRAIAETGIPTLRFDLGGIGDSQTLRPDHSLQQRTMADIRAAVDYLANQSSFSQFVIGGLCSGAEDAFRYAASDDRVAGVVMIDPHAYRTTGWYVRNILSRRLLNRIVCKALKTGGFLPDTSSTRSGVAGEQLSEQLIDYKYMDCSEAKAILDKLLARDVKLHYVFTGERLDKFNHDGQLRKMYGETLDDNGITVSFLPTIGHIQVFQEDRQKLIEAITRQLGRNFLP